MTGSGSDGEGTRVRPAADLPTGYLPLTRRLERGTLPPRRSDAKVDAGEVTGSGAPASLRQRARRLGVSHEAVRQAMRAAGVPTDLETRDARIKEMAARGVPWPAIAQAFGMSPSGVRFVCRDLPARRAGRPGRVT